MSRIIQEGSWVDIQVTVLEAGDRAQQVPEDTAKTDLIMKVKGTLIEGAEPGSECTILTPIGRRITGTLIDAEPTYTHRFGAPVPELIPLGRELRKILSERGNQ